MRVKATVAITVWLGATLAGQSPPTQTDIKPDNYYAAGNRIEITRPLDGDLVVAGREIQITQGIGGDILAAGMRVTLSAPALDDVRIAGAEVVINAPIRGDITIAGGDVSVGTAAHVTGRSFLSGGTVAVNGTFDRDVRIAGQYVTIGGEVRQPLLVIAEKVTFEPTARIMGPLSYKSPIQATIAEGAVINGPVKYEQVAQRDVDEARGFRLASSMLFATHLLIVGLLVTWLSPRAADRVTAVMRTRPWHSLLAGFVLLVTVPVAAIFLIISVLGLPLGLALTAVYATAIFLAVLTTAFFVGEVEAHAFKQALTTKREHALWLAAGVLTLAVLRSLPVLGTLVVVASVLFGLGALTLAAWTTSQRVRPQ